MSSNYETLYILRPDLTEEQVQQEVNKYRDFLNDYETEELQVKVWGKRRLAYPIKKQQDGIYVQMNYTANGKQVAPMERAMRLSDEVIRYLTLKVDKEIVQVQPTSSQPEEKPTQPSPAPTPPVALEPSIPVAISAEEDDFISAEDE